MKRVVPPSVEEVRAACAAFLVEPDERWQDAVVRWEELENTLWPHDLRREPGPAWSAFCEATEDEVIWEAKKRQENPRFWAGDPMAKPGGEYGRAFHTRDRRCTLCQEHARCFSFKDNENYGEEGLCLRCLQAAIKMVKTVKPTPRKDD